MINEFKVNIFPANCLKFIYDDFFFRKMIFEQKIKH